MQVVVLTNRMRLARHFDLADGMPPLSPRRYADAAIHLGPHCDAFELFEEMTFRLSSTVCENPARMGRMFLSLSEKFHQFRWHLHIPALMFLRSETDIGLGADVVDAASKINVRPRRVHHFLLTTRRAEEKFISNGFFFIHHCKQLFQFIGLVGNCGFFLVLRQVSDEGKSGLYAVSLQEHENE